MFRHVSRHSRLLTRSIRATAVSHNFSRLVTPTATAITTRAYSITTDGKAAPQEVDSLSTREYHHISDEYLENLVDQLEMISEEFPVVDAEYSHGVLTLELPPNGTYVINKQPPNKQIWLSSPLSGPDRFDPIEGKWISLRTGESLGDIMRREVQEALGKPVELEGVDDQ